MLGVNTKRPADANTYDTQAHTHRVPAPPTWWGAREANRAVNKGMRVAVGESWPRPALENISRLHRLLSVFWEAGVAGGSWWW